MKLPPRPRILIVPDSFKGTLSAPKVAEVIGKAFLAHFPNAHITCLPLADGGEGSSSLMSELVGATKRMAMTIGPEGQLLSSFYFYSESDQSAYIELAASSGITQVVDLNSSAKCATSYGTGQLIKAAIEEGARRIFLFLGGSATTDAGVGIAKALGYEFLDAAGNPLPDAFACNKAQQIFPGEQLELIASIKSDIAQRLLENLSVIGVADVKNPLYGENGAAYVYGPQKGADQKTVALLDAGLRNVANVCARHMNADNSQIPGAGAAGGAGFGVLTFLRGQICSGPKFFLEAVNFDELLKETDLVITGEGKIDSQSIQGKLLSELVERTKLAQLPLLSLSGIVDLSRAHFSQHPQLMAFGIGRIDAMTDTAEALYCLSQQIARILT